MAVEDNTKRRIILKREPFSQQVTIEYENGESDYVDAEKAKLKLKLLGVKNPDVPLDHVWNFYHCEIVITTDD